MSIKSYTDCAAMFQTRRRKLARNTYLEAFDIASEVAKGIPARPSYAIKLHQTRIVTYHADGRIVLDSGGWRTPTTKERMNDFSPIRLWQDKAVWYCVDSRVAEGADFWNDRDKGKYHVFADGITFHADGRVTGAGDDPKAELKLRKRIKKYATDLVDKTLSGELDPPGPGDCWYCALRDAKTGTPMGDLGEGDHTEHLRSHLDENYLVPSLLYNAAKDERYTSIAARSALAEAWNKKPVTWAHVARPQLISAVANYFYRRFSMAPTRAIYGR